MILQGQAQPQQLAGLIDMPAHHPVLHLILAALDDIMPERPICLGEAGGIEHLRIIAQHQSAAASWCRGCNFLEWISRVELADLYWELAPARGVVVDPAVACVQLYRDGHSAAGIDKTYHNPCGLKITAGGGDTQASPNKKFSSWREGVTAHLYHLALYAGASGYPKKDTPDSRHFAYLHGTAKTVRN
ncbi:hypothetical protein [Paenibacillus thiaminolyticus]|uniref:hypothetical protein n=1 Tax=Paenibacillus thiaminolyticus TaxID=49283 RepID=UPI0021757980|nr:hypothetical protein [Paenibacillus thiaminolyticus]